MMLLGIETLQYVGIGDKKSFDGFKLIVTDSKGETTTHPISEELANKLRILGLPIQG